MIVSSEFLQGVLVEAGLREDLFTVIPWTIPDPGQRIGRPSESGDVYFVGRLEPETKGIERLVERWNRAKAAGRLPGLRLNLVGTGPLEGNPLIEGEGVTSRGFLERDELDRLLLSGRAVIVPSLVEETYGLAATEGLAAGLPVLATDRGALPETVGPLGEGCLLPADSDRAWADGLARLDNGDWVDRVGDRARELFEASRLVNRNSTGIGDVLAAAADRSTRATAGTGATPTSGAGPVG